MKPIFTIHAGEYLVGNHLEQHVSKNLKKPINVWLPSKDTGIDLLVTDKSTNKKAVSLQVKFSKDFSVTGSTNKKRCDYSTGWWNISKEKLKNSPADFWVFVMFSILKDDENPNANPSSVSHGEQMAQYVVISPKDLEKKLEVTSTNINQFSFYLAVPHGNRNKICINTRGIKTKDRAELLLPNMCPRERDFSNYLNNWNPVFRQL